MKTLKKGFVLWFTGLPCSGKTTLADAIAKQLQEMGYINIQRLDGDEIRTHLCDDLGFSREDRKKNLERVGYIAKLLSENGVGVLASFVSPYKADRDMIRGMTKNFIEVFMDTSLEMCENRDIKGMYAKARAGIIKEFTGVSDVYERPENPEITIFTEGTVEEKCKRVENYLITKGVFL